MNLTTVVPSQQTVKDLALLVWFALLPFAVHITLVGAFLILLWTQGLDWLERRRERLL